MERTRVLKELKAQMEEIHQQSHTEASKESPDTQAFWFMRGHVAGLRDSIEKLEES